jgi:Family of unknown function (DUF6278)
MEFLGRWLRRSRVRRHGFTIITPPDAQALDGSALEESLRGAFDRLRDWAGEHGLQLTDQPRCLDELDRLIDWWSMEGWDPNDDQQVVDADDPEVEVGLYLGHVMVRNRPGARWDLTRDGVPFVRLASGRVLDVIDAAESRVQRGNPRLMRGYAQTIG